jgi:hypothetical protein
MHMDGLEEDATSCMRIVTWNCQGGFRHKADKIAALQPDIAIIQECEAPDRLPAHDAGWSQRPLCWHGDNPRGKGVAVFASFGNQLTIDPIHDPSMSPDWKSVWINLGTGLLGVVVLFFQADDLMDFRTDERYQQHTLRVDALRT